MSSIFYTAIPHFSGHLQRKWRGNQTKAAASPPIGPCDGKSSWNGNEKYDPETQKHGDTGAVEKAKQRLIYFGVNPPFFNLPSTIHSAEGTDTPSTAPSAHVIPETADPRPLSRRGVWYYH